jgi:hypothetical protein
VSEEEKEPDNCEELKEAIHKTGDEEKGRQQYLIKRAVELGCVEHIPDDWEVKIDG